MRTRQWPSFAESIGDRFTLTCAAVGHPRHDAEDLTQSFFLHLLENETLQRASRERGRFRSFLLGTLKRCLADEHMQQHTLKRGGANAIHLDDELEAEEIHHLRANHEAAPDEILDARWAGVVLERALDKVRAECAAEGKANLFEALSPFLGGTKPARQLSGSGGSDERRSGRSEDADLPLATAIRERRSARDHADSERPPRVGDELRRLRSVLRARDNRRSDYGDRRDTRIFRPAGRRCTRNRLPGCSACLLTTAIEEGDQGR